MYGWESFLPSDYGDDDDDFNLTDIPDVAIDPETHLLTACNTSTTDIQVFYISVYNQTLTDAHGTILQSVDTTTTTSTEEKELIQSREELSCWSEVDIESDVQP
eukprot:13960629-Ditylum_brightwellii.AAC.1